MRLDLFLKTTGLIRRRAVAKALCDAGRAVRNGHVASASDSLRIGDVLTLQFPTRTLEIAVLDVPRGNVPKEKRDDLFQIRSERKHDVHDIVNQSSTRSDDFDEEDGLSGPIF